MIFTYNSNCYFIENNKFYKQVFRKNISAYSTHIISPMEYNSAKRKFNNNNG